ncbi:class I SAM-dependent methyltransferase [Pseudooceanicola algae]|uniref:Ribosomal RNA small subunit methyltransferase C n=1 Tax=Pseudooceanicola algae TaxID=1537215 RepID=A0A418SIE2_9RHOB|nr:methyltransferase [Pseudooceanicola algae]QPM91103.1 Ribosomal RNA small subunit methyltransferase C [Pseudooceanicola algae]
MIGSRLPLALDEGGLVLPDGPVAVLAPRAGADLTALPKDRLRIVTGFYPDHAAFRASGHACALGPECAVKADGAFAAVIVCLPRAKAQARGLIAAARTMTAGPVIVDGQKEDGIDSVFRDCRRRATVEGPVNKAHGRMFWMQDGDFADWAVAGPQEVVPGFTTLPGVFSADGVDPASALLAEALPALKGRVADLGAGWGWLSAAVLKASAVTRLDLVEADHSALACARRNVTDTRAAFHWADARDWQPETPLDAVVMNPPFHNSRAADPELGRDFIRAAARGLNGRGQLLLVANRHLPYEPLLDELFVDSGEFGGNRSFKLLRGLQPRGSRSRQAARGAVGSPPGQKGKQR